MPLVAEAPASYSNIPQAILGFMQPCRDFLRAEITTALGIAPADWTRAIRQLKAREGSVQKGEKRGAKYTKTK